MNHENGQWMPLLRLMVANAVGVAAWAYVSVEAGDEALELYDRLPRSWILIIRAI